MNKFAVMNRTLFLLLFLISFCFGFSQSETVIEVANYIMEYDKLAQLEENIIWNISLNAPILVTIPEENIVVANQKVAGFKKYKDVYYGQNKDIVTGGQGGKRWNNKNWAFFTYPFPTKYNSRVSLFFHECFHWAQDSLKLKGMWTNCSHFNESSARILLKLEIKALQISLKKEGSIADIKNALCFRKERYLLYETAKKDETSIEILEGLAEYTGRRLAGYLTGDIVKYIDEKGEYNGQTFAYLTGLLYGYSMDYAGVDWRKQITISDNFLDFTANIFNITLPDSIYIFNKINRHLYGYNEILQNERGKAVKIEALIETYLNDFWQNPVLEIEKRSCTNVVFNSNSIVPLKNGKVYNRVKITGDWGEIIIDGYVYIGDKILVTEPKQISGSIIKGRGWNLQLKENWLVQKESENRFILTVK